MIELTNLKNIGEELAKKLNSIGINSAEELIDLGSKEVFSRLKLKYPNICLVHLQALEGAILDTTYNQLPKDIKQNLKDYNDSLKKSEKT